MEADTLGARKPSSEGKRSLVDDLVGCHERKFRVGEGSGDTLPDPPDAARARGTNFLDK